MKKLIALMMVFMLSVCCMASAEQTKTIDDFVFVGNVKFGTPKADIPAAMEQYDISYSVDTEEDLTEGVIGNYDSWGITNYLGIDFRNVEIAGYPTYGSFDFDDSDHMAYVRYTINTEENDIASAYETIERILNNTYGTTEYTSDTGKKSYYKPSFWPFDYSTANASHTFTIGLYSERFIPVDDEHEVLIQHMVYTGESIIMNFPSMHGGPYHMVCYSLIPNNNAKTENSWGL